MPAVQSRVHELTTRLIAGLRAARIRIVSPCDTCEERSAIVSFTVGDVEANRAMVARLAAEHVTIALRGGVCRVSPSFYNTEDEVDHLLRAIS